MLEKLRLITPWVRILCIHELNCLDFHACLADWLHQHCSGNKSFQSAAAAIGVKLGGMTHSKGSDEDRLSEANVFWVLLNCPWMCLPPLGWIPLRCEQRVWCFREYRGGCEFWTFSVVVWVALQFTNASLVWFIGIVREKLLCWGNLGSWNTHGQSLSYLNCFAFHWCPADWVHQNCSGKRSCWNWSEGMRARGGWEKHMV